MERGARVSRRVALIVLDALSEALSAARKQPLDPDVELVGDPPERGDS